MTRASEPDSTRMADAARRELAGVAAAGMSGFLRQRLVLWAVRSVISVALAFVLARFVDWLWWLPWAALALAAASLAAVGIVGVALRRKIGSASHGINRMEQAIREYGAEQENEDS